MRWYRRGAGALPEGVKGAMMGGFAACLAAALCVSRPAQAQIFTEINEADGGGYTGTHFDGVTRSAVSWADYDGDHLLDVVLSGLSSVWNGSTYVDTRFFGLYESSNGSVPFTAVTTGIIPFQFTLNTYTAPRDSAAAWADYDRDGDLDVAVSGKIGSGSNTSLKTEIYRNNGNGTFTALNAGLTGVYRGALAWFDYDNDGDSDLVVTGDTHKTSNPRTPFTEIYRNDGLVLGVWKFTPVNAAVAQIPGLCGNSSVAAGDLDRDGDCDLLLAGTKKVGSVYSQVTLLYCNDMGGSGTFTPLACALPVREESTVRLGDANSDGYLDVLFTGQTNYSGQSKTDWFLSVSLNNWDGTFGTATFSLSGTVAYKVPNIVHANWADWNNDGNLDIVCTVHGASYAADPVSKLHTGSGNGWFAASSEPLLNLWGGEITAADYNNDRALDLLMTGYDDAWHHRTMLYRSATQTDAPNAPILTLPDMKTFLYGSPVKLSWRDPIGMDETPRPGLGYWLRVGKTPGGRQVVSPNVSAGDVASPTLVGNVHGAMRLTDTAAGVKYTLKNLKPGTYYWSVRAIDGAQCVGPEDHERRFVVTKGLAQISATPIGR
jgi:hypothetical protein